MISFSQIFNGVEVGKPLSITQNSLKSKGFIFNKNNGDIHQYSGKVNGESAKISIVSTPITKIVWKLHVEISTRYDWPSIKSEFEKYSETFIEKYGEPKSKYNFFSSPYEEGDGYEMLAIYKDKCDYFYSWEFEKYTIILKIDSYKYGEASIIISYENKKLKYMKSDILMGGQS